MQAFSDPARESDPHALPDVEVFRHNHEDAVFLVNGRDTCILDDEGECLGTGWYYWFCFPGCLPDSEPVGPFTTFALALTDAREGSEG